MLVKHIRENVCGKNFAPFATIVALDRDKIGVAICSYRDHFDRKMGTKIAKARAELTERNPIPTFPKRWVWNGNDIVPIEEVIAGELHRMVVRAQKYFKQVTPTRRIKTDPEVMKELATIISGIGDDAKLVFIWYFIATTVPQLTCQLLTFTGLFGSVIVICRCIIKGFKLVREKNQR